MKFADTSWWVAWALPGDARHDYALGMLDALGRSEQVLTSNLVVGETWTFLRRKDSHRTAVAFLDRIGALTGIPAGIGLYATERRGLPMTLPPAWWLLAVTAATIIAVAGLTAIPAWAGSRRPVTEALRSE